MTRMELSSPAFRGQDRLPPRCARAGDNTSPPLSWTGVPREASELALMCEGPEAPSRDGHLLWLVTGIDPRRTGLAAGTGDPGSHVHRNSYGEAGWGGPDASDGEPRPYVFRLYALPAPVSIPHDVSPDAAHKVLEEQSVDQCELVALY
ncbi:YbhB/YbcL family Raf kinase inhibitor-like protein [Streptomyces sp. EN27]|uniref:YbhB/YbcL family Raf kinase inhibitor-like protein n=1 Tax=Streptomyces sp. EN27 TaxID=211464 RepID=UPI000851A4C0